MVVHFNNVKTAMVSVQWRTAGKASGKPSNHGRGPGRN